MLSGAGRRLRRRSVRGPARPARRAGGRPRSLADNDRGGEAEDPGNVSCILADVLHDPLPAEDYDAVFSISALHHMPLRDALPRLAATLRPGGVLAAVGLPRRDLPREVPIELLAAAAHRLFGAIFLAARLAGDRSWFAPDGVDATMPVVLNPPLTTREVRQQASAVLADAQVRRLVFWRYLLLWRKPRQQQRTSAAWASPQ